jgi:L-iditol 2-dehydrogenase
MSRGRSAVITEYGRPLEVRELPVPDPEPGALVVRVEVATICGTDVHLWQGDLAGTGVELPVVPGHEAVGRVIAIGDGADRDSLGVPLREGDRIVWTHGPCGHCKACTVLKRPTLCRNRKVGMNHNCERFPFMAGTFAEYSYVWPEAGRIVVPDEVPSEWASASSCPLRTAVGIVETAGQIHPTDVVVVQGAGPLGLFTAALVSLQHPRELVVIGGPAERLRVAAAWGATASLNLSEFADADARSAAVSELTNGDGADVVLECSGVPAAFGEGLSMAAAGARVVVAGIVGATAATVPAHLITVRGLSVKGSFGGSIDAYWKGLEFLRLHRDQFDVGRILGNSYRLDEVTTALARMRSLEEIKPVIRPDAG